MDLPEFRRRLAARVRQLRDEKSLRQEDLEEYGLAWKTIQKLEYGKTDPKASTMLKLCRAFDVELSELLAPVFAAEATNRDARRPPARTRGGARRG